MKDKKPEYDRISVDYVDSAKTRGDREMVMIPTAKHYLGNLENKRVLDLACGDGYFTRLIKAWGAKEVIGVDLSPKMIELANLKESQAPQGIKYFIEDVTKMSDHGQFDIIFAAFLLHYAESKEDLNKMARNISRHLKEDGQFLGFNANPDVPLHEGIKYDVETVAEGPLKDGTRVRTRHYKNGQFTFEFTRQHYNKETYETALKEAGFKAIIWRPFVLARDASDMDRVYYDEYAHRFTITNFLALKRK